MHAVLAATSPICHSSTAMAQPTPRATLPLPWTPASTGSAHRASPRPPREERPAPPEGRNRGAPPAAHPFFFFLIVAGR